MNNRTENAARSKLVLGTRSRPGQARRGRAESAASPHAHCRTVWKREIFLIARLIEEILLRTRAQIVVIDPNGDFRRICDAERSDLWIKFANIFSGLSSLCEKGGLPIFDIEDRFREAWETRLFQYVSANPDQSPRSTYPGNHVKQSDLFVHWQHVSNDEQDFLIDLLNIDPLVKTKVNLGNVLATNT